MEKSTDGGEREVRRATQKEFVAQVLAGGGTYADAGAMVGRTSRTVLRWMKDPDLVQLVADLRQARLAELSGRLGNLASRALSVIEDEFLAEKSMERLRASDLALAHNLRYERHAHTEATLARVIALLDQRSDPTSGEDR